MSAITTTKTTNVVDTSKESAVASRKLEAAELRKARKAARDPRNRLLSDSSDEVPRGILKNARIPTKRSVSECVDDLSHIMEDLDLNIHDFPKSTGKFCLHHHHFNEEDEENDDDEEDEEENSENSKGRRRSSTDDNNEDEEDEEEFDNANNNNLKTRCDCNNKYGDRDTNEKPKKSVRFDERVYETFFFASRLYDRRSFAKYHFSTRHHPPTNQANKSKKNRQRSSKSESSKDDQNVSNLKSDNSYGCKQTKSQRAKQSKKDKKKRLMKKDDVTDTSSDDQGYCSSFHSFSD